MSYCVTIHRRFAAEHAIRLTDGQLEKFHAHRWGLMVTVARTRGGLDRLDTVMDFHELERIVEAAVVPLKGKRINNVPPFNRGKVNPTAERVASWISGRIEKGLPRGVRLMNVALEEAPGCVAGYQP